MKNMLLEKVEYRVDETSFGAWRRFLYPDGQLFEEFVSHQWLLGVPLVHFTRGKNPETGKRVVATGIIAVGRMARGVVAIGQASIGVIAIGQLAIGLLFGLGQASTGMLAIGQLAVGAAIGLGQFATGTMAVGQLAFGRYVLAQFGIGEYVWDMRQASPIAKQFFQAFLP
jgi:hypothetical protein